MGGTVGSTSSPYWKGNSSSFLNNSRHKSIQKEQLHVLSISASVTRLRWRPPAHEMSPPKHNTENVGSVVVVDEKQQYIIDRHEAMLAVSTAPVKGASAGGCGMIALWSYHRPFMPLSVLEGHNEGAVTDFLWYVFFLPSFFWTNHLDPFS